MPEWRTTNKTRSDLKRSLEDVVAGLEDEVTDNPPFAEVAGLQMDELATHAAEAVAGYQQAVGGIGDPVVAMQIYCMGFVIGKKYGEGQANASPS